MEAPRIQYATTSDGVSIAFADAGEGDPIIGVPPIPWSNAAAEWTDEGHRSFYGAIAARWRWVRYDSRGSGSSDREIPELDAGNMFDSFCLDIDAVAEKLGIETFAVAGIAIGGPVAIRYAATRPQRVSKLALWCSPARLQDVATPQGDAMRLLRNADFDLFTETAAHAMIAGWGSGEMARNYAAFMRKTGPARDLVEATLETPFDMTEDLAAVRCPTLVLHREEATFPEIAAARYIAARVPDSQLVIVPGGALLPWVGDMDSVMRAYVEFFGGEAVKEPTTSLGPSAATGMVTVLFTDIEGSTTLTQKVGDARAQEIVRAHNAVVREALAAGGGKEIKHTGDGIMASFPLASRAVEAAIAIQRGVAARGEADAEGAFRVRIGLNAGEPVEEGTDLFGSAVQLARRVCDAAPAGSVYVTDVVRQLVAGKGFLFTDQGETALRGFEDPVRLYEVSWRE